MIILVGVMMNEPHNYTNSFDCVYRSHVRDYPQGISRLHGGRRMKRGKYIEEMTKEERSTWKNKIKFLLNDLKTQKEVEEKLLGAEEE